VGGVCELVGSDHFEDGVGVTPVGNSCSDNGFFGQEIFGEGAFHKL
jgi:hypothetical protein